MIMMDIKEYSINDAPTWIDRIQPKNFITSQINSWGIYVHGIWNFSGRDKRKLSEGVQLVYGNDGICYLYSGVTSTGSDNASMGFVLTNSRTKETTFYKSTGSIETAIQKSAQNKVSEKGYIASFPRPYNINGVWTYIMALKDNEGLIKLIAMVSYENYQIVGIGENIFDALRNYKSALNSTGNVIVTSSDNDFKNIQGDIIRINFVYNNNTNYAYFILSDYPNKLFVTTSNISNEVLVSKVGDVVNLKVLNTIEGEIFVDAFDNLNLKFDKTEGQIKLENDVNIVNEEKEKENLDRRVQSKLENMTEEEKRELVK
jgi:ribosomal protein S8